MASVTVQVKAEELDETFLKNVRALFKDSRVRITFESDDVSALAQIEDILTKRVQEGAAYSIPGEAFDALLRNAEVNEDFDVVKALQGYKKQ